MSQALLKRRNTLKGLIMRVLVFTNDIPDACTKRELSVKVDTLERNFQMCFEAHLQLLDLTGEGVTAFEEIEFEAIQNAYETAKARLLDHIDVFEADRSIQEGRANPEEVHLKSEIKLPLLKIPPFSGDYSNWKSFRDLFLSAIGDRRDLTGAQKLHYLKSFLEGEAAQLLRAYNVSDGNYRIAWTALDDRYNNKRLLVNAQFQRLFGQPAISNESAMMLRQLMDTTSECVQALRALELPTDHWDAVIVYIVTQRLDSDSHKHWEISLTENEIPTFASLVTFMEKRCRSLEAIGSISDHCKSSPAASTKRTSATTSRSSSSKTSSVHHVKANPFSSCAVCDQNHSINNCKQFQSMNVSERREKVRSLRLCFTCLQSGHFSTDCKRAACIKCLGKHHEMLHIATGTTTNINADSIQTHFGCGSNTTQVLLSTAWVTINESTEKIRVLIDPGSNASIIRESCVQRLNLQRKNISVPVRGIGGTDAGTAKSIVKIKIKSCVDKSLEFDVTALVMRKLTGVLPNKQVNISHRPKFVGLMLADPTYYEPGEVEIIIGADIYGIMLLDGIITGSVEPGRERPTAQNTALGWILSGPIVTPANSAQSSQTQSMSAIISMHLDIEKDLRRFWEIEEVCDASLLNDQEKLCETHFTDTHVRDNTGRYVVRLPFITEPESQLGNSRVAAERRLRHIERRLSEQPTLRAQYQDFMNEYALLGHMKVANRPATKASYFLPHHFVVKESSSTTRLRVVFDASCKTTSGRSLNDLQLIGPRLQEDMATIVMRFRKHAVALTADITKMYRQVAVNEADWDYQRILWRSDTAEEIKEWQLTTVTYGMAASPFLAVRALQQLAMDEQQSYPRASRVIMTDFYVDDLITGCDSSEEAADLRNELCDLMSCAGMELRKWSTNCEETQRTIPEAIRESSQPLHLSEDTSVKTLGLQWFPAADYFAFKVSTPICEEIITKRAILSVVARLFDPLGLLSPSIIVAKIMIQQLWTLGIAWDDEVPEPMRSNWKKYHISLNALEKMQFPRWIGSRQGATLQFHGFSDASESAYGAVIYVRCEMPDGLVRVSLLTAKTRVAPLQQITLPRLELCAAVLLAKLFKNVKKTFGIEAADCVLWTDSQVTLCWIRKAPKSWKTFVANRVSTIQSVASPEQWRYVPSAENPADCLSRGVLPTDLLEHPLWSHGPKWLLSDSSCWPANERNIETSIDERNVPVKSLLLVCDNNGDEMLNRYSSLTRLKRITALLCRFGRNCRVSEELKLQGNITVPELKDAMLLWIRHVQAIEFAEEIRCCKRGVDLERSSKLLSLNPYLDAQGVLRVGGRLRHAAISKDAAHPAILPGAHHLTKLVISEAHITLLHGGVQMMLNYIRQRYWIIGAKGKLRQYVHSCVTCVRQRSRCGIQQMGDLPAVRVNPSRAFWKSGVDYAGPMEYKSRAGRGFRKEKGYVALFVCLSTKAIHLEFVSDLSTVSFIAAFRRFVARRGKCSELLSDNATNFIGARRELGDIIKSRAHNEEVSRILSNDNITWRTIPPRSPHFGGIWEAGVKSVKHHLRRIVGNQLMTFEEFSTMLAEIEAVLNSRPLCSLSDDPNDLNALTPGHFLIGSAPVVVPERDFTSTPINRLTRWQLVNQMTQHFWRRWHKEYLSSLQQRYKWTKNSPNVQIGQLVLLKDELLPPAKWRLARVIGTQPGQDGQVRVVILKHATGETTRAITRICILPIHIDL